MRCMSLALAPHNIRVNAVAPGRWALAGLLGIERDVPVFFI